MEISPVRSWRQHPQRRACLGEVGIIVHYTVVHAIPYGMPSKEPYIVALIRFGDVQIVGQVVDVELAQVKAGMRLVGRLRRMFEVTSDSVVIYGVKFAPYTGE